MIEIRRIAVAQLNFCVYLVQWRVQKFGASSPFKISNVAPMAPLEKFWGCSPKNGCQKVIPKGGALKKKKLSGKIEGGVGGIGSPLSPPRTPRHATDLVPYDVTSFRFSWNN